MENNPSNVSVATASNSQAANNSILEFLEGLRLSNPTTEDFEQPLNNAIELILNRFSADNGYILVKGDDGENLELLTSAHKNPELAGADTFSEAITAKAMQTNQSITLEDVKSSQDFARDPNLQRFNVKSAICVPINSKSTAAGAIYLDSVQQPGVWNTEDVALLSFVADYIGLALETVRLKREAANNQRLITAGQVSLDISHSVKNIVQLIIGAADVIDFGLRTNEIHRVKRSWDILKPNLERIRKFMLDMLDFSKERHLELGPCEFNKVIQGAIESFKSQLRQKKVKLNIRIDQQIPVIELDGERIHEMAANLILNALDIVDQDTGTVSVETKYLAQENTVQLRVTDNGPGISEEAKGEIFQPFKSSNNKMGTGLGLAIAKKIVDQHKSKIEIESELGKGATFIVTLPAKVIQSE